MTIIIVAPWISVVQQSARDRRLSQWFGPLRVGNRPERGVEVQAANELENVN
jgi:hypothetical protein